jgi:Ca2+:H+ antiporter
MAGAPIDRIPLYTILLPALGVGAWLVFGKAGLGPLALLLGAVLLGNVLAAVHHAEVLARRLGEPYGTLVLALAVTVIEAGLIISLMLGGDPNPGLMRDAVHAAVMLVMHGLAGVCIIVASWRHRNAEFRVDGANSFLAVLIPMATLVLIYPNHVVAVAGPYLSNLQLGFVAVACLALYGAFLFIQTNWHRDFFMPVEGGGEDGHGRPSGRIALAAAGLMCVALFCVVVLAKALAPALEEGVAAIGAPLAIVGVIVAAIVLMPESAAAVRAAASNRLQSSINLALGSAVACIGLTVPAVAAVAWWIGQPLALGVSASQSVLLGLSFAVAIITYGTGRTNLLCGAVHLVLAVTYVFSIFAP